MDVANLFSVKGKVTVITGGSRGIGRMIAEGFVCGGAKVYITARKAAACDATAEELSQYGECISIPIDCSTIEGCKMLAAEIGKRETKLDVLINNAGAAWGAPFDEFPEAGWDKVMDLNTKSVFFLTQAFAPLLRAAATFERPAKVINVASIDGMSVNPQDTFSYHTSKAGLIHLTHKLGVTLAPENIAVSGICPGAFPSEMNKVARDEGEMVSKRVPSRRVGIAEDMAGVAIYLASKAGDYVVGQSIAVDGGVTLARG